MSLFGFSISDVVLIADATYRASQQLNGQAAEDYRECAMTCRRFKAIVTQYEPLVVLFPESIVRGLYRDVNKILRKIDRYKPLLGSHRKRWSIRSAMAKLRWPQHAKALRELSRDLESKIQLISSICVIQNIQLSAKVPTPLLATSN